MRHLQSLPWLAICLLPRLFQSALAQVDPNDKDHGVRWVYPSRAEDYTFHYMDTVEVEWTSYFDQPLLYTFCSLNGQPVEKSRGYAEAFNGSKTVLLDWTDADPPCWFNLRPNTSTGYGSNSNTWGYDLAQRSQPVTLGADISSTATTSEPTRPATTANTATIATNAATTASPGEPSSTASDATDAAASSTISTKQLSVGAQAGIGVGAGAAGIGLGVLGAILWIRRRKRQKEMAGSESAYVGIPAEGYDYKGYSSPSPAPPPAPDSHHYGGPTLPGYAEMDNTAPRTELEADRPAAELSAGNYGR